MGTWIEKGRTCDETLKESIRRKNSLVSKVLPLLTVNCQEESLGSNERRFAKNPNVACGRRNIQVISPHRMQGLPHYTLSLLRLESAAVRSRAERQSRLLATDLQTVV